MMALGYAYACKAGVSFGKDDLVVPASKVELVGKTEALIKEYEQQYQDGQITQGEKYNKVVDAWSHCTDAVADEMMKEISTTKPGEQVNSVYMMAHSGARGSAAQMKQLAGMRGLMAKPSGEIIETPIISNFKEGLTVLEYFNSTHGARKGLADTALKTANSGYLTRRLVDVTQDCIILEEDCGTTDGITVSPVIQGGVVIASLGERVLGRTAAEDVVDLTTGEVLAPAGTIIDEEIAARIDEEGTIESIKIRSVLTCKTRVGVCGACYGRDSGTRDQRQYRRIRRRHRRPVDRRARHPADHAHVPHRWRGAGRHGAVEDRGQLRFGCPVGELPDGHQQPGRQDRDEPQRRTGHVGRPGAGTRPSPFALRVAYLAVEDGARVGRGDTLAEWDPYTLPIVTEREGIAHYVDLVEGVTMMERMDEATGISSKVVIDWKAQPKASELRPRITLRDDQDNIVNLDTGVEARYFLSVDAILSVQPGQRVYAGDVLARVPRESAKTRDITGGLPRVAELFEARKPKDHAIISEIDGTVQFGKDYKSKRRIVVVPQDESEEPREYLIPKGKHVSIQEGDFVRRGDPLMDGNPVPHDILRVMGVEALADYLITEIQDVYRLQGVKINDKHIEVIVRQMLQKVEITEPGDTTFLVGEQIDRIEFDEVNAKAVESGGQPAAAEPVLQGITKASLQTQSFISAASFQETTRVLTEAAVSGKVDNLLGLKENVIVGRLIPAGTGSVMNRLRAVAADRDREMQEHRRIRRVRRVGGPERPGAVERIGGGGAGTGGRRRPRASDSIRNCTNRGRCSVRRPLLFPNRVRKSAERL